jgi:GPH family glycoside/pentoside/hexuronide:cation symporter
MNVSSEKIYATLDRPAGFVSARIAAGWGVGTLATTTMLNGVSVVLLYFLVTIVQIEPFIAGALLFGSKMLDVVTDPPMGIISDRTRSRYGRRRPWMLGASFFCGTAFAMLFNAPEGSPQITLIVVSAALAIYALSYTAFQIPYMAMPAEMTDDYHQRTKVMSWRVVFMTLGNMTGAGLVPALVEQLGGDRPAYGQMGLMIGGFITVVMLICFFATASARQTQPGSDAAVPLRTQLRWLGQNKPLLILMGTKICIYVGLASNIAVAMFFFAGVLKFGGKMLGLFLVTQAITSIAFLPVAAWLSRKIGKKRAYVFSLIGFCCVVLTWLLATPDEPTAVFIARALAVGIFGAGAHLYGQSMLVDTFAWDYTLTGVRREGVLSAAFSFVEKACMAFGPLIIGILFSSMGFDKTLEPTADQSESAVLALYLGFVWIPVGMQLISLMLLKFYTLDEQQLNAADSG